MKVALILVFLYTLALQAKEKEAQKLDFDEVVVKTMTRKPGELDTVGVIGRKGKTKELYQKRTDFSQETRQDLRDLKEAW